MLGIQLRNHKNQRFGWFLVENSPVYISFRRKHQFVKLCIQSMYFDVKLSSGRTFPLTYVCYFLIGVYDLSGHLTYLTKVVPVLWRILLNPLTSTPQSIIFSFQTHACTMDTDTVGVVGTM